jgi:hypothetical protein
LFSLENSTTNELSIEEPENHLTTMENPMTKQTRQRLKRQPATDAIPLVEFHDALSQSTTYGSDTEQHS